MMPPPNVTAVLHMGHGLNNTVQDVLVRFERMRGRRGALAPGHRPRRHRHPERGRAAARQGGAHPLRPGPRGVRRAGLGLRARDRRAHPRAAQGHRLLGRLVAHLLHAGRGPLPRGARGVRAAVRGRAGLPRATTSSTGAPAASPPSPTRRRRRRRRTGSSGTSAIRSPTAAATSPSPPPGRRRCWATPPSRCIPRTSATAHLIGRELRLPLVDRLIPIVADEAVDPAFGSGAVKVTPAHDPDRLRDRPPARPAEPSTS